VERLSKKDIASQRRAKEQGDKPSPSPYAPLIVIVERIKKLAAEKKKFYDPSGRY
jgi:hypothetical protein